MNNLNATKIGFIAGLVMVALSVVFYFALKWPINGYSQFLIYAIYALGITWAISSFVQKTNSGSPKNLFSEGFKAFVVMTLLMVVFTFAYYKLNPQILEDTLKQNNELIRAGHNRTEMEIEENANKLRSIFMPMTISLTMLRFLAMGAIFSIILSMLLRKRS